MTVFSANAQALVAATRQNKKSSFLYGVKICLLTILLFAAARSFSLAQCIAPVMSFHSPELIAGTDHEIGAVYRFPQVIPGIDANIEVANLTGGAQIWNIDDSAGIGYYDAFQPYVVAPANSTSYVDWNITFKVAGTSTDTVLSCFSVTGVDVDGNGSSLQEFIEAATPGSYAMDPFTILSFSFDGVRSKAISTVANIALIDTAHREAMFQMNFSGISSLQYRNGAISTFGSDMVRQTSIYFKSFFDTYMLLLPVKLLAFTGQVKNDEVSLNWSATNENDLKYYVVQKSINGSNWSDLETIMPGASATNHYFVTDAGKNGPVVYYRLRQIQRNGQPLYSKVLKINTGNAAAGTITHNTIVKEAITLQIAATANDTYIAELYAVNGSKIKQQQLSVYAGYNSASVDMPATAGAGLYILTVKNNRGELLHQSKLIKN